MSGALSSWIMAGILQPRQWCPPDHIRACRFGEPALWMEQLGQGPAPIPNFGPMARSAELRKSGFWTTVVLYGLALAVLVVILKYVEYRFLIRDLSMEVYIGVVAVLFTALGIWAGSKLLAGKKNVPAVAPHAPNEDALRSLGISARELEVLQLMASGLSNQEIADKLFISLPTVKSHSSSLFVKLDVSRRTQAAHKAKSLGIIA